jgi:hypothetical protein
MAGGIFGEEPRGESLASLESWGRTLDIPNVSGFSEHSQNLTNENANGLGTGFSSELSHFQVN